MKDKILYTVYQLNYKYKELLDFVYYLSLLIIFHSA